VGLNSKIIMSKFHEIISKYIEDVVIDGNDILIEGKKVLGSMERRIGRVYVWAAQISFEDHSEIIKKICNKQSIK
jgi:lipoate-protein ligase A